MAFAEVGSGSQRATTFTGNADSVALAFPGNVTSGSLLIVGGTNWVSGGPAASVAVTDTRSTSYTVLQYDLGEFSAYIAYGLAPSSGACTVTVDPAGTGNYISYAIDEFSGPHATPLNVDGGGSTGTGTAVSDGLTTTVADCLIIGVMGFSNLSITAITPTYTQIGENEDNSGEQAFNTQFRIVTTAQAYTMDWTLGTSRTWYAMTAAFKPVSSPKGLIMLLGDGGFM